MTAPSFPFERVFSLPALEGARAVRAHLIAQPHLTLVDAIAIVKGVEIDASGLDLEACHTIVPNIPREIPNDGLPFYRGYIRMVLLQYQPIWTRTMLLGKSRFYSGLDRDEQSIFRQAGILDEPPDDDFVEWWDSLTGELRLIADLGKLARGRAAERLTLDHERAWLAAEGIDEHPRWIGLEDNTKGYDVLSFEKVGGNITNKLIEVKSTIASPLRFRVTRNEWEQAERSGAAYLFHVWDLQKEPPVLHVRTVDQVRPHIPTDNEKGKWKDAEIPVGG